MDLNIGLPREKKYLLGVSGGCDSMMLLSLCLKQGYDVVVCFVNYGLRESADYEEKMVCDYCREHGVEIHVLHPVKDDGDNFQQWAREARYQFYREIYHRYQCEALLLGHQKDDHVENYLMALERGSHGWYYGILRETEHHGMKIIRPLLEMRKSDTRRYCEENGVPYHDDESNFTDHYQHNRIRHALVEKADDVQIEKWCREIDEFNEGQRRMLEGFEEKYTDEITREDFLREERKEDLLRWLLWKLDRTQMYSSRQLETLVRNISETENNGYCEMGNDIVLAFEYGVIYAYRRQKPFCYVLEKLEYIKTPYFVLSDKGKKIEQLTVSEEDFPLTVRNWQSEDMIELRYGHKKVSRFLIDRKVRRNLREIWPVIVDKNGTVIFVCGIGCDVHHYSTKPNLFVLK